MDEIQNMAAEMLEAFEGDIEYGWEANGEQIEERGIQANCRLKQTRKGIFDGINGLSTVRSLHLFTIEQVDVFLGSPPSPDPHSGLFV